MQNHNQTNLFAKLGTARTLFHTGILGKFSLAAISRLTPGKKEPSSQTPGHDDILRLWDSRSAAISDVMARIAHQWRQPLSTITLIMQNLHDSYRHRELDPEDFDRQVRTFMKEVMFLSHTIDGVSSFFADDPVKDSIAVLPAVEESLHYLSATEKAQHADIEITGVSG